MSSVERVGKWASRLLGGERQRLRVAREGRFRVYDEIRARNQEQHPEEIEDSIAQAVTAVRQEKETDF